ncbi:hypothetical protein J5N97_028619 [Dioscorea zingiberensis]|uniref:non-specific serine/threonine protein kinase n=1 Tax=Dioscorea zingiberensis TaxID=325984 RepID=A0A9D5H525_9LILI|nr:hypothetical protein J5N97_028619 [Dioscorea zingiberensis]
MMPRRRGVPTKTLPSSLPFLLLLLVAFCLPFFAVAEDDLGAERSALIQFKASVSADPSGVLSLWSGSKHCSWPGVSCDSRSRVVSLNISAKAESCPQTASFRRSCSDPRRKLAGKLSPEVGRLSSLRVLVLPFHGFEGEIPNEIWSLGALEVLDLEGNSLFGSLPLRFPPSLRILKLGSNLIGGEIPLSLSECKDLETLDLSNNQINGSIPNFFNGFPKLRGLYLSYNQFGGEIPNEIGTGCRNLEHLDLAGNLLTGGIPTNLGSCAKLQSLLLFSNLLDGVIPSEFGNLEKLQTLDVSRNCFSSPVPPELGNCKSLSVLVLLNLFNPNPDREDPRPQDEFNNFQGEIPENITSLPNLRILWAPRAMLGGRIPSNWGACESLEMVHLGQGFVSGGTFPTAFSQCYNLKFLNLSSGNLTGWLDERLPVPCMDLFDVSWNLLSGSIPMFTHKQCSSHSTLDDLPSAYFSFFAYRTHQQISSLSLLPTDFAVYHNFGWNNFTGSLPSLPVATDRFGAHAAYAFLADGNKIDGALTDSLFEKCKGLKGLIANFSNNMISSVIPADIGSMCGSLVALDLAGNHISGAIPQSLSLLDHLVALDLSRNWLQGPIPGVLGQLKNLELLSLAKNNLNGSIPASLDQLHSLKVLDLSSNSLEGEIPSGISDLRNLSVLLLNSNRLYGQIPPVLANFTLLGMFNASYNNLSGPLPLNASMNMCNSLLGNPLIQSCTVVSLSIPPSNLQGGTGNYQSFAYPPPASSPSKSSNSGFSSIEIASITSASAIVSVLIALIILYVYTRKCAPRSSPQSSGRREVTIFTDIGVPVTYETVVRATGSFNASNCIGSGGFGATYKAEISPGVLVAIKRLSIGRFQGVQQFHAEIKTLGRWRHPNLVTLIGYHVSEAEMFLIYNYLPGDFGLARLLGNSETHATTGVAGTFGYVAPEYAMTCRVSDKADVYSYGVVLLELISDKKALDPSFSPYGNGFNIVAWACMLLRQAPEATSTPDLLAGIIIEWLTHSTHRKVSCAMKWSLYVLIIASSLAVFHGCPIFGQMDEDHSGLQKLLL